MKNLHVQYGCGLTAPEEWLNFDASPTLRIQKLPLLGALFRRYGRDMVIFPPHVRYGDIVKGLPITDGFCAGVFCSHVLEHLSLMDFRKALGNTYKMMKPGGVFRCIVPDLEWHVREYLATIDGLAGDNGRRVGQQVMANTTFFRKTLLGCEVRPRRINELARFFWGTSRHLWMWDVHALSRELVNHGFRDVGRFHFNECEDEMFLLVEDEGRFVNAVALQCRK